MKNEELALQIEAERDAKFPLGYPQNNAEVGKIMLYNLKASIARGNTQPQHNIV